MTASTTNDRYITTYIRIRPLYSGSSFCAGRKHNTSTVHRHTSLWLCSQPAIFCHGPELEQYREYIVNALKYIDYFVKAFAVSRHFWIKHMFSLSMFFILPIYLKPRKNVISYHKNCESESNFFEYCTYSAIDL